MDDIANILRRSNIKQPDEIKRVKNYIYEKYTKSVNVTVKQEALVVSANSASLVNDLRLNANNIIEACGLEDKKIIFKIS
jgi:hypothetical protein